VEEGGNILGFSLCTVVIVLFLITSRPIAVFMSVCFIVLVTPNFVTGLNSSRRLKYDCTKFGGITITLSSGGGKSVSS
jgi:hypothetical protein